MLSGYPTRARLLSMLSIACVTAALARAQAPGGNGFTYQGRLDDAGVPAGGAYDMSFALFDALSGGAQVGATLWFDGVGGNPPPVAVADGLFTVQLDFGPGAFVGDARWLEISVRPHGGGAYAVLTPRQSLTAAPFSLQTRGIAVDAAGNVGVGTMAPEHDLHVTGDMRVSTRVALGNDAYFGLGNGVWPQFDRVLDFSHIVTDFSSSQYWAPIIATVSLDPNVDLTGPNSKEIYANNFETHVSPTCDKNFDFVTGFFGSSSHRGSGHVYNNLGCLLGGVVEGSGSIKYNHGIAVAAGCGHYSTGHILENYGISIASGNWGEGGTVGINTGLLVQTPFTHHPVDVNYGIYLENQEVAATTNYAIYSEGGKVYFNGDLEVTGAVAKGGGSFKIDHPLDPQNKYLYHSFVESSDMMNIYNGNVSTDAQGYAVVELPDWFEALNRDFRYQLTVLDESDSDAFVQAKVVCKIEGNKFTIRTNAAHVEISWQVTGVRHDAWANANRISVEVNKPQSERGTYQHPEAHGQPAAVRGPRTDRGLPPRGGNR